MTSLLHITILYRLSYTSVEFKSPEHFSCVAVLLRYAVSFRLLETGKDLASNRRQKASETVSIG